MLTAIVESRQRNFVPRTTSAISQLINNGGGGGGWCVRCDEAWGDGNMSKFTAQQKQPAASGCPDID